MANDAGSHEEIGGNGVGGHYRYHRKADRGVGCPFLSPRYAFFTYYYAIIS